MKKSKWQYQCPHCKQEVGTNIKPLATPRCRNYEGHHSNKAYDMVLLEDDLTDKPE